MTEPVPGVDLRAPLRSSDTGDVPLIIGIARRQPEALAEAYERHSAQVHALAKHLVGERLADRLMHVVFMRLWQTPEAFDADRSSLRTYLLMLTYHRAEDTYRGDDAVSPRKPEPKLSKRLRTLANLRTRPPTPDEQAAWQMVDGLSGTQGDAVLLCLLLGDTGDAAALLGTSETSVRADVREGLTLLHAAKPDRSEPPRRG